MPEEPWALDAGWLVGGRRAPVRRGLSPLPTAGPGIGLQGEHPRLHRPGWEQTSIWGSCSDPPTGSGPSQRHPNATPGTPESRGIHWASASLCGPRALHG